MIPACKLTPAWPPHLPLPLHDPYIYMYLDPTWPLHIPWSVHGLHMHPDPCTTYTYTLTHTWPQHVPWLLHEPWPLHINWPLHDPHKYPGLCLTLTCIMTPAWPSHVPLPLHDLWMYIDPCMTPRCTLTPHVLLPLQNSQDWLFQLLKMVYFKVILCTMTLHDSRVPFFAVCSLVMHVLCSISEWSRAPWRCMIRGFHSSWCVAWWCMYCALFQSDLVHHDAAWFAGSILPGV